MNNYEEIFRNWWTKYSCTSGSGYDSKKESCYASFLLGMEVGENRMIELNKKITPQLLYRNKLPDTN